MLPKPILIGLESLILSKRISESKKQMELSNLKTKEGEERLHLLTEFEERLKEMVEMVLVSSHQKEAQLRRMTWCLNTQKSKNEVKVKVGDLINLIDLSKCDDIFTQRNIFFDRNNSESPAISNTTTKRSATKIQYSK